MKRFLLGLLILAVPAHAGVYVSFKITASGGAPIPTAYSSSDTQSAVASSLPAYVDEVCVYNGTSSVIAIYLDSQSSTAPTADTKDVYVPASTGVCAKTRLQTRVYLRSASGSTITSGVVYGSVFARLAP